MLYAAFWAHLIIFWAAVPSVATGEKSACRQTATPVSSSCNTSTGQNGATRILKWPCGWRRTLGGGRGRRGTEGGRGTGGRAGEKGQWGEGGEGGEEGALGGGLANEEKLPGLCGLIPTTATFRRLFFFDLQGAPQSRGVVPTLDSEAWELQPRRWGTVTGSRPKAWVCVWRVGEVGGVRTSLAVIGCRRLYGGHTKTIGRKRRQRRRGAFTDLSVELRERGITAVHPSAGGQGALGGGGHGLPLGAVASS